MGEDIRSESKFVWKFIGLVLLTPITLIQILFRKKSFGDLFSPFSELFKFLFEAKFTIAIIIINIVIFFLQGFLSEQTVLGLINYPNDLITLRLHTFITAGFLHADISHLLFNMLGIFIMGRVVEKNIGFVKTALVYFGALILSHVFTSLVHLFIIKDNIGGLGASGALMGLVSAAILLNPFYITYELIIPLPVMLSGWLAIYADISGIINPVEDGIGHFAHLGGFISIGLLMFLLGGEERTKLKHGLIVNLISLVVAVGIYFFVIKRFVPGI